jgi:REP element-mobilizing transposase RayT
MTNTSHGSPSREPNEQPLDSQSRAIVVWRCFDPEAEVAIRARNRPHWDQNGAVTFVTLRLADSMPKAVVQQWLQAQEDWLVRHGLPDLDVDAMLARSDVPRQLQRAFTKFRNQHWNADLDNCHGSCLLRNAKHARLVANTLVHFDGDRYDLERFVVMPNHVHLLVQMRAGWELRKQCESWMRYSGRQLHAATKTSGPCWAEPFDHVVRDTEQFEYLRQYIVDNPRKARLGPGEFLLWIRELGFVHDVLDSESRATGEAD